MKSVMSKVARGDDWKSQDLYGLISGKIHTQTWHQFKLPIRMQVWAQTWIKIKHKLDEVS